MSDSVPMGTGHNPEPSDPIEAPVRLKADSFPARNAVACALARCSLLDGAAARLGGTYATESYLRYTPCITAVALRPPGGSVPTTRKILTFFGGHPLTKPFLACIIKVSLSTPYGMGFYHPLLRPTRVGGSFYEVIKSKPICGLPRPGGFNAVRPGATSQSRSQSCSAKP